MSGHGEDGKPPVQSCFPFPRFVDEVPSDVTAARRCFATVRALFENVARYRPFELLRSGRQRARHLLTTARVVAMTCTHAAMCRQQLLDVGFKFDTVVMEEAAQIPDFETFLPLLLQSSESDEAVGSHQAGGGGGGCRLKRIARHIYGLYFIA